LIMPIADTCVPERGHLGLIKQSSVPSQGFLGPVNISEDIWIVRRLFSLGAGQTDGLTWTGLRKRVLEMLGDKRFSHPALSFKENESTEEQLVEEICRVKEVLNGEITPFPLDSTMTIIRKDGRLTLHSVVPLDGDLLNEVRKLGEVTLLLVPNLQHWLFVQSWLDAFPLADVGLVPAAHGEDLEDKMKFLKNHGGRVFCLDEAEIQRLTPRTGLTGKLIIGAPLSLNEFVFYHPDSGTLIASDSFYGGYTDNEVPTWFARFWFKLTKSGSFRAVRLPIYRTSRVISHGDPELLLDCVEKMIDAWDIKQITFAHGTSPFNKERMREALGSDTATSLTVGDVYFKCWKDGLKSASRTQSINTEPHEKNDIFDNQVYHWML